MSKLTWIEGENACWEGVEMTNEAHQKRFGCLELLYGNNDDIIGFTRLENDGTANIYYVGDSERQVILNLIKEATYEHTSYSYEDALAEAHGFSKEHKNLQIGNVESLLEDIEEFILISKLPNSVKVEDYEEFQDVLDIYYEELSKNSI